MFDDCTSLASVRLGSEVTQLGTLPTYEVNGHTDWYSNSEGKWFTSEEINASRLGIDDVYTKVQSADSASDAGAGDSAGGDVVGGPRFMHRLYNQWSGEHFYTADDEEFAGLVEIGWADEGIGWMAPETSDTPVYRLYNPYAGEHHYTMDAGERDAMVEAGWVYENIGWYSDDAQTVPLFREYNPYEPANNHNYTTDADEHEFLVSIGWHDEGIAWYGV